MLHKHIQNTNKTIFQNKRYRYRNWFWFDKKLTDEDLYIAIPEILALNEMKPDFICLWALSRNVFYDILRSQITQPFYLVILIICIKFAHNLHI